MSGKPGRSGPPQNDNAFRHGLFASARGTLKQRDRRVRRLVDKVRAALPSLAPSDLPALRAWAELEILSAFCFLSLTNRNAQGQPDVTDADGSPRKLLDSYRQLRQAQLPFARELGLTPAARKALGLSDRREVSLQEYVEAAYRRQDAPGGKAEARAVDANDRPADADSAGAEGIDT